MGGKPSKGTAKDGRLKANTSKTPMPKPIMPKNIKGMSGMSKGK